ncbi:DNA cytosine methyltransferase [Microbacterium sp.]|uniref:DNA cytosine methyltransferase n=1 Tax=Microbacterium sp. TaxID=51671 RepID=UPI003F95E64D
MTTDFERFDEMREDMTKAPELSVLGIRTGADWQSSGLEMAGAGHSLAVEIDCDAAATLRLNRPEWDVHGGDVRDHKGIDLLAGEVPCPPLSTADEKLRADDERDLSSEAIRLASDAVYGVRRLTQMSVVARTMEM